jgi:hypothetical protein
MIWYLIIGKLLGLNKLKLTAVFVILVTFFANSLTRHLYKLFPKFVVHKTWHFSLVVASNFSETMSNHSLLFTKLGIVLWL